MLPRKNRFSFKGSLPKKVFRSQSFSVRYEKNGAGLRVAVVVSKKVDKRATVRNKIKRKILDIVRKQIEIKTPFDLVFYLKKQAIESLNLTKEVQDVVNKLTN